MAPRVDGSTASSPILPNYERYTPTTQVPTTPTGNYTLGPTYGPVAAPKPTWTVPPDNGFANEARGQKPQWGLDTDLSKLSADAYNVPGDANVGKWTRVDNGTLKRAGIDPKLLDIKSTGFRAAIYSDGEGRVVLAFAGTDGTSGKDWLANAKQGLGLDSKQYDQAIKLAKLTTQKFGEGNVVLTGHSLGGGLASAASLATRSPAVTFNAAGIGSGTLEDVKLSRDKASDMASGGLIRRYNVENDILTNAQQSSALPDALGYEITLENPNSIEDPIRAHLGGTVISAMESKDIKTQQNDNWFKKNVLESNLFPMGPSIKDIGDTAGKVLSSLNPFD